MPDDAKLYSDFYQHECGYIDYASQPALIQGSRCVKCKRMASKYQQLEVIQVLMMLREEKTEVKETTPGRIPPPVFLQRS